MRKLNNIIERISNAWGCLFRERYVYIEITPSSSPYLAGYANRMNVSNKEFEMLYKK